MSTATRQAAVLFGLMVVVLGAIATIAIYNNRHTGLRVVILSAQRALPGETITITVSARDTDGGIQAVDVAFDDGHTAHAGRTGTCHHGPSTNSFDFRHAYPEKANYTVKATVLSGGCGARTERATNLRTIEVKPLQTE